MVFPLEYADYALLFLRIAIAAIFIKHGLPKITGAKTMGPMMGMPSPAVLLLGLVELLSGLAVLLGIGEQIGAGLLAIVMLGAMWYKIVKWKVPFAAHDKNGWEFDLILLAASILLLTMGGGELVLWR